MGIVSSSPQPIRVFTVTGTETRRTISRAISTIAAGSRSHPAPAPPRATFGTQQPQFTSRYAGSARSAMTAAAASERGSAP